MANQFYPKAKQAFLSGQFHLLNDTIKAVLVSNAYVFATVHEFATEIEPFIIGSSVELKGKTIDGGVFDAEDIAFLKLPSGHTVRAIVLFKDTGVAETSRLIDYIDTVTGLPMITAGGDVQIRWDDGAYKIFSL
ncbi:hypothetical protein [Comamonas sp. NoAH]|uniref:hypothetical protein n=1 Tax=Comamonas halotolerans TaxID=3041496 RepID=UPI0024E05F41|nr:hypothetical protein [Comamonas sp. NoAH]